MITHPHTEEFPGLSFQRRVPFFPQVSIGRIRSQFSLQAEHYLIFNCLNREFPPDSERFLVVMHPVSDAPDILYRIAGECTLSSLVREIAANW